MCKTLPLLTGGILPMYTRVSLNLVNIDIFHEVIVSISENHDR
jgi:hypothetical protein